MLLGDFIIKTITNSINLKIQDVYNILKYTDTEKSNASIQFDFVCFCV